MINELIISKHELSFGQFDHPFITLHTQFGVITCMIDTGFSLGLVLPKKLNKVFKNATPFPADLVLGNGSLVETKSYLFNVKRQAETLGMMTVVSFDQKEGLVGIEFLRLWGLPLVLDWRGQRVEFLA